MWQADHVFDYRSFNVGAEIGEAFHKGQKEFPANPEHLEFQVKFWKLAREFVGAGGYD